jgi:hypothetical protein
MSALPTRIENKGGRALTAEEIFEITRAREKSLSRLLILYITTGLAFMLLLGTFLGVCNLLAISTHRAANSVSAGWVQAHGQAQIFGWIGTFILGIGFYSIPKLRPMNPFALGAAWTCWVLWTAGISLRWWTGVYQWQWRFVLPLSAVLIRPGPKQLDDGMDRHLRISECNQRMNNKEPYVPIVRGNTGVERKQYSPERRHSSWHFAGRHLLRGLPFRAGCCAGRRLIIKKICLTLMPHVVGTLGELDW